MVKNKEEHIQFQDEYYLVSVDSSLKRPGFAVFHIIDKQIKEVNTSVVDNKTKVKPHGQLLDEIISHFITNVVPNTDKQVIFLRQHIAPNHFNENAVVEVVGFLNWYIYKFHECIHSNKEWYELYPVTVKKEMTGNGKAQKHQVAYELFKYPHCGKNYKTDDESDAVALGLAFLIRHGQIKKAQ